jgi:hypothetical protein
MTRIIFAVIVAVNFAGAAAAAWADERDSYYYPAITSEEVFSRDLGAAPPAGRAVRVGFATQITKAQLAARDSPRFVIFAKGDDAQHMIVVALDDQVFKTIYRARAVLAQLTSNARGTDFFIQNGIQTHATWFDLAKMLGFKDLVISDGVGWSHRVMFE